ncbi:MAG: hypothetical protein J0M03_24405 [Acidobacteria bacterium]|nr:hypothetical protein [Acidobacteriota bacterium]
MAKKIHTESDPSLARSHEAGAKVTISQIALHEQYGTLFIGWPDYWTLHINFADDAYKKLVEIEESILRIEPNQKSHIRLVDDETIIVQGYKEGFDFIVHLYLALEHYTLNVLRVVYGNRNVDALRKFEKRELSQKTRHILNKIINRPDLINSKGYSCLFSDLEQVRHRYNHPLSENIYNGTDWEKVPLAWILSGKFKKNYNSMIKFF